MFNVLGEDGGRHLEELFSRAREQNRFMAVCAMARSGDTNGVRRYFNRFASAEHVTHDSHRLLDMFLEIPKAFPSPDVLIPTVSKSATFDRFFTGSDECDMEPIWSVYAKHQKHDVAIAGGYLAAEFLRVKILADETYQPNLDNVLQGLDTEARNSAIRVQGALVDLVQKEGPSSAVNTGIGFLHFMGRELPLPVTAAWTQKISGCTP